ncbi:MAG TPA: malto-oligosyltrehalose trehalohydrolase [Candidatus Dormibacteraeota bacterium]|nr:malto-oligosyltrehalose trehalohydrolase [Candidatus Dormibacteraeota bacterium]
MTHSFRVWAPDRRRVDLVLDGHRLPMGEHDSGWWEVSDPDTRAGTRYGFSLDGGEARPDPRSLSQPDGVLGLSQVVDHAAHLWHDGEWRGRPLEGSIIYELHTGTFSAAGTFDGVSEHIEHLARLGVTTIELMPVAEFSGMRGWGYDGAALFAPHHAYGGPAGLKRLVEACHASGLAVLLDVVYNHLGPVGNFLPEFGPYFSDRYDTGWGPGLNYDGPGSEEVRRFVIDNALMWIRDYHLDGLRLDAVQQIVDQSPTHVLEQLAAEVDALESELGRTVLLVAETEVNDARFMRSREAQGYGLDAAWSDDWHHSLHAALTGEQSGYYRHFGSLELLGRALRDGWVYDGPRSAGRLIADGTMPTDVMPRRLVVAAQNHDQVGNRAAGERLGHLVDEGSLKVAAALLLTAPFTPLIFQGEEWASSSPFQYFTDHADEGLGRAVSDGRRREFAAFGWGPDQVPDPQDPATFERSRLDWSELDQPLHRRMLDWYRDLIRLRGRFRDGPVRVEVDAAAGHVALSREGFTVLANLGDGEWRWPIASDARVLLASGPSVTTSGAAATLPRSSVVIVETSKPNV